MHPLRYHVHSLNKRPTGLELLPEEHAEVIITSISTTPQRLAI
ncbi:hypothetical protein [Bordetella petrii]